MGFKIKYEKISLSDLKKLPEYDYFNHGHSEFKNLLNTQDRKLKGSIVKQKFEEMVISENFLNCYSYKFNEDLRSPKNMIIILGIKNSGDEFALILPKYYGWAILGEISSLKIDDSYNEIVQSLVKNQNQYKLNTWTDDVS